MIYNKPQRKKSETWVLNKDANWMSFVRNLTDIKVGVKNTVQTKFVSNGVTFDGIGVFIT